MGKADREIADEVVNYHLKNDGHIPNVICPFGHPDMVYDVLANVGRTPKKANINKYGWGENHRRSTARVIKALRSDDRFKECRVMAHRPLIAFDYLPNKEVSQEK